MKIIPKHFYTGGLLTILYLGLFIFYQRNIPTQELLIALPFVAIIYFFLFNVGNPAVQFHLEETGWMNKQKSLLFPILLWFILIIYVGIHHESPFKGSGSLLPFLFVFPVLYYQAYSRTNIGRVDYLILLLFIVPLTLINFEGDTTLPVKGNGFGSMFKISWALMMVYAFGQIRKIKDIGFYPIFKSSFLGIALISWISFLGFVYVIAWTFGFVNRS